MADRAVMSVADVVWKRPASLMKLFRLYLNKNEKKRDFVVSTFELEEEGS